MFVALDAGGFARRRVVLAATITCGLFLATSNWSFAADDGPVFQRCAIVATSDVQATALGDLLTAKLSAVEGIELVELFHVSGRRDRIVHLVWDGESLWVATAESGIQVISPQGIVLGRIHGKQGLPPYDVVRMQSVHAGTPYRHPLLLHAVSPGQCIAMGRFGPNGRIWIATVSDTRQSSGAFADSRDSPDAKAGRLQYEVDVIHRATRLSSDEADEADEIFDPVWLVEYSPPGNPARRKLLVGRRQRPDEKQGRRPLIIDLNTLRVRVHTGRLPALQDIAMLSIEGCLACATLTSIEVVRPAGEDQWIRKSVFQSSTRSPILPQLIRVGNTLFNPGRQWRRVNCEQIVEEAELLNDRPLPHRHGYRHFGLSAYYGLVAWNEGDRLHRVLIDGHPGPSMEGLASEYFYVPKTARQEHARAVEAIRDLGGSVDTLWGIRPSHLCYFAAKPDGPDRPWVNSTGWYTIVFLPKDWRGSDGDLVHLRRLHNLRAVWMVQADVTDEGLRHLARLDTLELIQLQETKVTDAGLTHLRKIASLGELWIEGHGDGSDLTDAGLAHLASLPKLERLTVYGSHFTDASVPVLKTMNGLRHLRLLKTSITADAVSELRSSSRFLSVSRSSE